MTEVKILGWKIRRRSDGKFSTGGMTPGFVSRGKTWAARSGLHGHFACVREMGEYRFRAKTGAGYKPEEKEAVRLAGLAHLKEVYAGCDVVEVIESMGGTLAAEYYLESIYKPGRDK